MDSSAWLRWLTALGCCWLTTGCLFHRSGDAERLPEVVGEPRSVEQEGPPAVPPLSDYALRPPPAPPPPPDPRPLVRSSGAIDPPRPRAEVKIGPSPEPARVIPATLTRPQTDRPVVAALRVMEEHPEQARQLLAALSPEEAVEASKYLCELAEELKKRMPPRLTFGKVCFCRRIESFGQYEPLPLQAGQNHPEFQAGSDGRPGDRIQVYVEVRNFNSREVHPGHFETRLNSSLEIRSPEGPTETSGPRQHQAGRARPGSQRVLMNLGTCVDTSQTRRQDYFLNFQFHVPARLPPGLYTLWVTVKDEAPLGPGQKPRLAERSLDFRVCPPGPTRSEGN